MNILLVSDDPWIRDSLSLFLQTTGTRFHLCKYAREGMETMNTKPFDMIICEYWLPDLDGLSFLNIAGYAQSQARRVLITGYPTQDVATEATASGTIDFVVKPFVFDYMEKLRLELTNKSA